MTRHRITAWLCVVAALAIVALTLAGCSHDCLKSCDSTCYRCTDW